MDITYLNIRRLRKQGLAYVPADRLGVGSAAGISIEDNLIINQRHEFSCLGFLSRNAIKEFTDNLIDQYNIAGPEDKQQWKNKKANVSSLSGGNMQKLILAREINGFKDYIVLSEPCRGLDFASSAFIRSKITELRGKNAGLILISSNLEEILELADRIMVMYKGKIAGRFTKGENHLQEKIRMCMQGLTGEKNENS
jgi:simple sugar transport system ATP-binding protein